MVRLQDGTATSNGHVEVCKFGVWGAVCNDEWDNNDAKVVCRQLGYDSEGDRSYISTIPSQVTDYKFVLCLDANATQLFGGENGLAFLSDMRCAGQEEKLIECRYSEAVNHSCIWAGVICGKSASENTILTKISTLPHGDKCS